LEALPLHHVAPVARRIADREEDRLALLAGPRERLLAPRKPVHRVVRVLEEVGAGGVDEAVGRLGHVPARLTRTPPMYTGGAGPRPRLLVPPPRRKGRGGRAGPDRAPGDAVAVRRALRRPQRRHGPDAAPVRGARRREGLGRRADHRRAERPQPLFGRGVAEATPYRTPVDPELAALAFDLGAGGQPHDRVRSLLRGLAGDLREDGHGHRQLP